MTDALDARDVAAGDTSETWAGVGPIAREADFLCWAPGHHRPHWRDAIARVWPLRRQLGITRTARLTDYDYVGIPVAGTTRPSVHDAQITATQGKGLSEGEALVSALFEAVERHAAAQPMPGVRASSAELQRREQAHLPFSALGITGSADAQVEWVTARRLRNGEACLVPEAAVRFPYFAPDGTWRPLRPSTTGLASGNTLLDALTQAAFEVIERDAVSRFREGARARTLAPEALAGSTEHLLLRRFAAAGVNVFIADLSDLGPIATFFACGFAPDGPGPRCVTAGQGAHMSPRIALRRALLELAQSRVVALQGTREDLIRHASTWQESLEESRDMWNAYRSLCNGPPRRRLPTEPAGVRCAFDLLARFLEQLAAAGYHDVAYVELTRPEIGLPVVRALIPGCVDSSVDPHLRRAHV